MLAASPGPIFEPIDMPVFGGRLVRDAWGGVTVHFAGLPPIPSWPIDTPEKRAQAKEIADGCLFTANFLHEVIHLVLLPYMLGMLYSPTLFAAAMRAVDPLRPWCPFWWAEEDAVLAIRRMMVHGEFDILERARAIMSARPVSPGLSGPSV